MSRTAYAPTLYAANRPTTAAGGAIAGFHVIGVVLGVKGGSGALASDHLYVDGLEVASYVTQGSSAGTQQGGNLFLGSSGSSPLQQSGFNGTMYRMVVYPGQISAATVKTASSAMASEVAQRGVDQPGRTTTGFADAVCHRRLHYGWLRHQRSLAVAAQLARLHGQKSRHHRPDDPSHQRV